MNPYPGAALVLLALAASLQSAQANYKPACQDGWLSKWDEADTKYLYSDPKYIVRMSECQASLLGFEQGQTWDILIGGRGGASIVGVSMGNVGKGCGTDNDCMAWCQALCCLTNGCNFAYVHREKDERDYVVYKETSYMYECRFLAQTPGWKKSDNHASCQTTSNKPTSCPNLVQKWLGIDANGYAQLTSPQVQNNNVYGCGTSGRRLLDGKNNTSLAPKLPSKEELEGQMQNWCINRTEVRQAIRKKFKEAGFPYQPKPSPPTDGEARSFPLRDYEDL